MPKTLVQCYNKGCLKKFDPSENAPDACVHHPGKPVFHDAYKSWSCCKARTTDFTEFLNIKGCVKSYHQDQKPPESPKPERKTDIENEAQVEPPKPENPPPRAQIIPVVRPDENDPMVRLRSSVGSSLTPLLNKLSLEKKADVAETEVETVVTVGTTCKNAGCRQTYQGEHSNLETCLYHSGFPIFHEGMKYWTCCQRKTSDFANFLEQQGCTSGSHMWIKKKTAETQASCRYDWYQTGSSVVISVFTKLPIPDESYVEANPVKLHLHITFGQDRAVFDQVFVLNGVVDVEKSSVQYLGTKVEVNLKKRDAFGWRMLTLPPPKPRIQDGDGDNENT
uniref:Putative cysteine and histidine-rich domain chord-containing zinc binding protein n=1 Tax=Amblyomma sculptum TaxID=1581419 RepID=A0A1E1XVM0_AMBSC